MGKSGKKTNGKKNVHPRDVITTVTSAGAISTTNYSGNSVKLIDIDGTPWNGDTGGKYSFEAYHIRLDNYFAESLFSWDYFRVAHVETTFQWRTQPTFGLIVGDLFYYIDKDDHIKPNITQMGNRRDLKHLTFSNERHTLKLNWKPYVVSNDTAESGVRYVQPRERWLNSGEHKSFRFGTLGVIYTTPNEEVQYPNGMAAVSIRHRVMIELKGQRSVQPSP